MATTLAYGAVTITLPENWVWEDEFDWARVEQATKHTLTGALRIDATAKQAGERMTLGAGKSTKGMWVLRSVVDALGVAAAIPAQVMTLTYRGTTRSVVFDQQAGAFSAEPLRDYAAPVSSDLYAVRLRLIKV